MDPVTIGGLLSLGGKLIDRLIPDKEAAAKAKLELLEMQQRGELAVLASETEIAKAQTEVNKAEATAGPFRGGWRPAIGWVCASGFAYQYLLQPLLSWASTINGWEVPPVLDLGDLFVLAAGMLGLGTLRSQEKRAGLS